MLEVGSRVKEVGGAIGVLEKANDRFYVVRLDNGWRCLRRHSDVKSVRGLNPIRAATECRVEAWKERGGVL